MTPTNQRSSNNLHRLSLLCSFISYSIFVFSFPQISSIMTKQILDKNIVYSIHHSQTRYMWFSTDTGISRYDGYRIRNFPLRSQEDSIPHPIEQAVLSITEDNNHIFYLGLLQGGITCFDEKNEIYIPIQTNISINSKDINCIYIDEQQLIYVGTNKGLYTGKAVRNQEDNKDFILLNLSEKAVVPGNITHLCGDKKELFIASSQPAIWQLSTATGKAEKKWSCANNKRVTAFHLQEQYLWICFSQGDIKCYDRKKGIERTISDTGSFNRRTLPDTEINAIVAVDKNTYYIATWNDLFQLSFKGEDKINSDYTLELVKHPEYIHKNSLSEKLTDMYWDEAHQILWTSTFGNGINRYDFTQDDCKWVTQTFDTDITGVEQDMQGHIWIATTRRGIWRSTTNSFSTDSKFEPWTKGVQTDGTYCIFKDADGFLWMGSNSAEILCINPSNSEIKSYHLSPTNVKNFSEDVKQLCVDAKNRLWVITEKGLILFDTKTNECSLVVPSNKNKSIKEVYSIVEDKGGNIWLGTNNGVKQIEITKNSINFHGEYEKKAGIETTPAYFVSVNSSNQLLVSYLNRVVRINERSRERADNTFSIMDITSGPIYCTVDDQNGNVWIGDNSGIFTIRNNRSTCFRHTAIENCTEVCRLRDGRLLWTNANELFYFDPESMKGNHHTDAPVLSEFEINGEAISTAKADYNFYSTCKNITFFFSDLQYNAVLQKVAYRLLPDEEWKTNDPEDGISFKNLPIGNYTLQVRLVYPNGDKSELTEISFEIRNVWWKTYWACSIYLLLFIGIVLGVHYYCNFRLRKRAAQELRIVKLKEKLSLEQMKHEQNEEIENIRDKWLQLFVQELRTPLSLIITPLQVLAKEQLPDSTLSQVQLAYRNSMGLLDICNRLSTIYSEKPLNEKLQVASYQVEKLANETISAVSELMRMHPIDFLYKNKATKEMEVYMDYKWVSFVIHNLLSNAFNHIGYKGSVILMVSEINKEGRKYCTISVQDSGKYKVKGLQQILTNSKDDFLKGWSAIEMGYEIMEKIILCHHGTMNLESEEGKGTKVSFELPIDKELLENDPNIVFVDPDSVEESNIFATQTVAEEKATETIVPSLAKVSAVIENIKENTSEAPLEFKGISTISKERKTVLIVEDHKDIRLYLNILLKKEYDTIMAINGKEGVDMANLRQPDLILCDIMMPVMDGFLCCKEIKEGVNTCHIPIIILTAKIKDEDVLHGLDVGADDYILKPFSPEILKAKIRNLINGRIALKQMYTRMLTLPQTNNEQQDPMEEKLENPFVNMVVKIVEENMGKADFNVKKLASDMNMSQPTLYRKIKLITDFTIIELIRGVRMRKAATLLQQKQYNIQEIAELVGYNDVPTFRKHFVDVFGVPPSAYANSVKN